MLTAQNLCHMYDLDAFMLGVCRVLHVSFRLSVARQSSECRPQRICNLC